MQKNEDLMDYLLTETLPNLRGDEEAM